MLLRRFIRSFRGARWLAVVVEFLIVVSGVLVGMQANAWSEARKRDAEAEYYLGRLVDELDTTIARFDAELEKGRSLRARTGSALAALRAGGGSEEFAGDFAAVFAIPDVLFTVTALDEMRETGKIGLLDDPEIRARLYAYSELLSFAKMQQDIVKDAFTRTFFDIHMSVDLPPDYFVSRDILTPSEEMADDPALVRLVHFANVLQFLQIELLEDARAKSVELREALAAAA